MLKNRSFNVKMVKDEVSTPDTSVEDYIIKVEATQANASLFVARAAKSVAGVILIKTACEIAIRIADK